MDAARMAAARLWDNSPEELQAYDLVVQAGDKLLTQHPDDSPVRERVASAMLNKAITLGYLYPSQQEIEEEIQTYDRLIQRFGQASDPALQEPVASALLNKGVTLGQLHRSEEAIQAYDAFLARFGQAPEPALQDMVATALNGIGVQILRAGKRLWAQGDEKTAQVRLAEAQQKFTAALQRAPDNPRILGNQAYVLSLLGDSDAARPLLTRAIELGGEELRQDALTATETSPISQDEAFKTLLASIQPPPPSN